MLRELTESTYKVALSMLKGATIDLLSLIRSRDLSLQEFFALPDGRLCEALNLRDTGPFNSGLRQEALTAAAREEDFMARHHIRTLFVEDDDYPSRLAAASQPPLLLYMLGDCDLNAAHSIGVVGTRRITPYGADSERRIIADLTQAVPDLTIVSGLAFGTDAIAHTAALEAECPTVGVVAHGLDTIYPAAHRDLAKRMLKHGGAILTEYPSGTSPYRGRFLERNRIVAWMTDATLVIESPVKGGAMSTAHHAFCENREVFALPGRINDEMSAGCNHLIRRNKASLVTSGRDIMDLLDWTPADTSASSPLQTPVLFPELEGHNKVILDALRQAQSPLTPDALKAVTGLPIGTVISTLTELEFDALVVRHPGNRYSI